MFRTNVIRTVIFWVFRVMGIDCTFKSYKNNFTLLNQ